MRRALLTGLLAALLLTGCSEGKPATEGPGYKVVVTPTATPTKPFPRLPIQGKPLPVKVGRSKLKLLQSDGIDAIPPLNETRSITAQVIAALGKRTAYLAGLPAKTTGRCEHGRVEVASSASTDCTITYRGKTVKWQVVIDYNYKPSSATVSYQMYPLQAVLLRDAVYAAYYDQEDGASPPGPLRCDRIPAIQVITYDEPTSYRCQGFVPQDDSGRAPIAGHWSTPQRVSISDYGIRFS